MRQSADRLAQFAGGNIGAAIGGRRGKPMEGALIGQAIAPRIIEDTALSIAGTIKGKRKQTKSQKARSKNLSKAMSKANSMGRLKNGSLRRGWTQAKIMKTAHRLANKR